MNTATETHLRRDRFFEYRRILAKHWLIVVAAPVLGLLVALTVSAQKTPVYETTTTLYISVRSANTGATGDLLQGANFAQSAMTSYTDIVTTSLVLDEVIDELQLNMSTDELRRILEVSSPTDSVLLNITATHVRADVAANIAKTTGRVFAEVVEGDLETNSESSNSPVLVRTVDAAPTPEQHNGSYFVRNGILGVFIGFLAGIGLAILRDVLDTRIHSARDLEAFSDLPVLGRIPEEQQIEAQPLVVHEDRRSQRAEAFRILRTNLKFLSPGERCGTFMVSSALPGEGKSHTVANLAVVLAESGARVTLIDADLRKPRIAQVMGIEGSAGLSDVLIDHIKLEDVLQPWGLHNLKVLPAGQIPPNPSELLGSEAMGNVVRRLEETSDYVLIDTSPILPVTDAAVVSTLTLGTLLVVCVGRTKWRQVEDALEALRSVESRLLGYIANREVQASSAIYGASVAAPERTPYRARARSLRSQS
ncbi:polysaccharide biosynthesis tyrosine autokinase [Yaniella halotolerans]|uniref:polysaccharide biosynthesis tyrosine autokinase n=1 Tax=Yaniella halotolerans TaxID=225453 RepID=UPI0003B6301F|nr:polysaccharide biosynthesis tyrosine autokinase [Yaniella halotolerans]